ncbi:MAG: GNAT family N-acetyltransferase [Georgfuchsia sp.]
MAVIIRNLVAADITAAIALQRRVYKTIPPFSPEQFQNLLNFFPEGQFAAEINGRLIGIAISLVILWDDYNLHHTWESVTNKATFDTHNMNGRTLYGAEVCVAPSTRGQGAGRRLYKARRQLCRAMNLKRIIAGGRLPGYRDYVNEMTPEEYAKRVIWGDIKDPVLGFQLDQGFSYCGILPGYLPTDPESVGNAALIVWLNPEHDPNLPTLPPPANLFKGKT